MGGKDKIRPLWRHYYQNTQGIIMVVDSNDRERIANLYAQVSARHELHRMLGESELDEAILLVLVNKQDLPNAMSVDEVKEQLALDQLGQRSWHIEGCCATTGDGLYEGLDWMVHQLGSQRHKKLVRQRQRARVNKTKSILLVSGYAREADSKCPFFTSHIPAGITKLVHCFFQDPNNEFQQHAFYGESGADVRSTLRNRNCSFSFWRERKRMKGSLSTTRSSCKASS